MGYEDLNGEYIETGDLFWEGDRLFLLLRSNIGAFLSKGGFIIGDEDVSRVELGVVRSSFVL